MKKEYEAEIETENVQATPWKDNLEITINGRTLKEDSIKSMITVLQITREQAESMVTDEFLERLTKELYSLRCEHLASLSLLVDEEGE